MKFWAVRVASLALGVGLAYLLELIATGQSVVAPRLFALAGLYVTLAVSLNLINGITGQFSLGHAAFYQVGAYSAGFLSVRLFETQPLDTGAWIVVTMVAGAVMAGLAGLLVGLPSLRLRGDYLAIVTLGFGEIIRIAVQNQEALGGSYGLNIAPKVTSVFWPWLLAFACIAVCRNMLRSAHGLEFLAVRDDEIASSAMGINTTRVKVVAFLIGSSFAGAAGALLAHYEGFISPQMFLMDVSFILVTMVVLGGLGSITGSILAAVVLFALPEYLRRDDLLFSGATLAGVALASILAVASLRAIRDRYHGLKPYKSALYVATVVAAYGLSWVLGRVFAGIPALEAAQFPGNQLRMVIFAATLIVLMLLRPEGVLGRAEFSWDGVGRLARGFRQKEGTR